MQIILYAFAGISFLNLCYHLGFLKFAFNKATTTAAPKLPVSVIICAKNEEENLKNFIPSILTQNHPDFEVIIINDASSDNTLEIIENFQKYDDRVKIVNVQNNEAFWANKKYALTLGIKKAKNPYLLFTDADCEAKSPNWIREMTSGFAEGKSIILGYGGYFREKPILLNKLIRFESLFTAIQYFSYAKWGMPYMGVGRNLAYTSKEFFNQRGFATHLHLRSGDDDLFVNEAATSTNTTICFQPDSITRSVPKKSFTDWFTQKKRHISVAGNYKLKHQVMLGLFFFSQLFFWILFLILVFSAYWKIVVGILIFRLLIQGMLYFQAAKKLNEKDLFWIFPFLEVFLVFAQMSIFISNLISKPIHWK